MSATDERYRRITAGVPVLDDGRLREVLDACFGVSVVGSRPLAGETDRNLWVADASGAEYVFKVCSAADLGAVRFQNALLRHLAEHAPDLPVPRVVAARAGSGGAGNGRAEGGRPRSGGRGDTRAESGRAPDPDDVVVVPGAPDLVARLLTWLPGTPLAEVGAPSAELLADVGAVAGRLAAATVAWRHPEPPAPHYWEFPHAATALADALPAVADPALRAAITRIQADHVPSLAALADLPQGVVHHDLNAFNLLVGPGPRRRVVGVIDFGDAQRAARVADLAILCAAAMRGRPEPMRVAAAIVAAYHRACPLTGPEVELLHPLLAIRAATVAATAARLDAARGHGDPRHRSPAAADLVRVLAGTPAEFGVARFRHACGLPAPARHVAVGDWLARNPVGPLVDATPVPVDLTAGSAVFDDVDPRDPAAVFTASTAAIDALRPAVVDALRPAVVVGRYGEPRFTAEGGAVTSGLDLFAEAGVRVSAPLAGTAEQPPPGVNLLLRHEPADGVRFWTLYTGLSTVVSPGDAVGVAQPIGVVGPDARLLVRVSAVPVGAWRAVPAEVPSADAPVWQELLPDPTPLLGARDAVSPWRSSTARTLAARRKHLPHTHPTYFSAPITMVRARDCRFYDEHGRGYLDALNNVTLLGHGHPRLVEAAGRQLRRLNTNSRFVYDVLTEYAEALTATLPDGLDVVYFLNSGSEANDLALRMARYVTGRDDVVIIDDAYHGYTATVADVSPSRYKHYGKPDTTHPTPVPDRYRGAYGYDDPHAGAKYARHVTDTFDRLAAEGRPPAAFLYEGLLAGGGQVVLPPGYLAPIHAEARRHGAFTIADEVQVGFGRLGEAFWGFQTQGVVPDFVTMGKAMGNGFPVSALVTTREISAAFDRTGRFFSTYGGNPVACAVGLELLRVLEEERLQDNAATVGRYLRDGLAALADRHGLIGDVRGQGFYSGVEFVLDRGTKEPAAAETLVVCERLKEEGVLVYPTGPAWNILKLKPPLTFTRAHADELVAALDRVLEAGW